MCVFSLTLLCWRKTNSCWRLSTSLRQGTWGQTSVGEGKEWVRGGRSTLALVRQNTVQALYIYTDAVKLSMHWNILEFMISESVHICWLSTFQLYIVKAQINCVCSQMNNTANKLCHQDCQTFTQSKCSWPTRCGITCMQYTTPTWRWYLLYMAGLGTAICSYIYAGDQTISQGSIKDLA